MKKRPVTHAPQQLPAGKHFPPEEPTKREEPPQDHSQQEKSTRPDAAFNRAVKELGQQGRKRGPYRGKSRSKSEERAKLREGRKAALHIRRWLQGTLDPRGEAALQPYFRAREEALRAIRKGNLAPFLELLKIHGPVALADLLREAPVGRALERLWLAKYAGDRKLATSAKDFFSKMGQELAYTGRGRFVGDEEERKKAEREKKARWRSTQRGVKMYEKRLEELDDPELAKEQALEHFDKAADPRFGDPATGALTRQALERELQERVASSLSSTEKPTTPAESAPLSTRK